MNLQLEGPPLNPPMHTSDSLEGHSFSGHRRAGNSADSIGGDLAGRLVESDQAEPTFYSE